MQIKRADLEAWADEMKRAYTLCEAPSRQRIRIHVNRVWAEIDLMLAHPDPVDVVPVQDYPFPINTVDPAKRYGVIADSED